MVTKFQIKQLTLPFRVTFKQASATRKIGASIWCEARKGNFTGYGEGCPRKYVTNETIQNGIDWLATVTEEIAATCTSLAALKTWTDDHRTIIDQHPAAFCAIETALLDLFAKTNNQSVECLLNLQPPQRLYNYTAVLGDAPITQFEKLIKSYLMLGFTDFKVKLSGVLAIDQQKLRLISAYCQQFNCPNFRIRLDANNLWTNIPNTTVIKYLEKLPTPIFAIEEPLAPRRFTALHQISKAIGKPIILDESLCRLKDLEQLTSKHNFIANLKVSKIGGLLRTLELINQLIQQQIPIIIGAHVGETSVLTRAGMTAANAVGAALVAQEGGFGLLLLEKDKVYPSLSFGNKGRITLNEPYNAKTTLATNFIPTSNWNHGWGLAPMS